MANASAQLDLSQGDQQMLCGAQGPSREFAMSMLVRVANCVGASRLIDISQAHLVGCYYGGPGDLHLVEKLIGSGAEVAVPTTLNASSADLYQHNLYESGSAEVKDTCKVVKCYQGIGARVELTCAPYHLPDVPALGESIAWAESNAIVYANSVLGARTNKTFQYLDLCAALTGRMPEFGFYCSEERRAVNVYQLVDIPDHWFLDDAFYQLLGLCIGVRTGSDVPVIDGLPNFVNEDQLRGLGASAAASGSLAMFHAVGLTPEAPTLDAALQYQPPTRIEAISAADIVAMKQQVSTRDSGPLSTVCLGTPHFSRAEFEQVLQLLDGRHVAATVDFYVTTSRHVFKKLEQDGLLDDLQQAGLQVVTDTCTYHGSLVKHRAGVIMTASGKWAYYAPGNLGVDVLFATVADCVNSAIAGEVVYDKSFWCC
ncbi:MAG: aconitase X catalytic domain-containing protein [Halioglobus sp.]